MRKLVEKSDLRKIKSKIQDKLKVCFIPFQIMSSSILVLGAGRSSPSLISYLQGESERFNWSVTVGDVSFAAAQSLAAGNDKAIQFDIRDVENSRKAIR